MADTGQGRRRVVTLLESRRAGQRIFPFAGQSLLALRSGASALRTGYAAFRAARPRGRAGAPRWADVGEAGRRIDALTREWLPVVLRLRLPTAEARRAARRALANRTGFLEELLVSGRVGERSLFRAVADELGLPFLAEIDPSLLMMRERHRLAALGSRSGPSVAMLREPDGSSAYVLARADISLAELQARLAQQPALAQRLRIAPPGALREAILAQTRQRLLFDAQHRLFLHIPGFSARVVMNGWQGACAGILVGVLPLCLLLAPKATVTALHLLGAVAFFSCIVLRLLAIGAARPLRLRRLPMPDPAELPVYSVLVALYREREVIPQLLVALGKLQWPHAKLEIKLVCEEDDHETLSALRAHGLRPFVEVVEVPAGGPRTKPKALAYALTLCSGEFVTLFDAEDRPHPMQLIEAWRRFRAEDGDLACLQAPLVVTNGGTGALARMFAFEYAGLFRGLLPWLASMNLVLPLGGTSNHFRRQALVAVGGWDAHNVTEDADLGLRLKRFGYRVGVITHPTFEDAPENLAAWLPQRVRWFKGWMQTWLVHMREPRMLWRELGPASFLVMQILFVGLLVSALIHPFAIFTVLLVAARLLLSDVVHIHEAVISSIGLVGLAAGYGAFLAIGMKTLSLHEKRQFWKVVLLTPVHWMLLSLAAWMALWEIWRRPHHWSKTPHRATRPLPRDAAAFSSALPRARR